MSRKVTRTKAPTTFLDNADAERPEQLAAVVDGWFRSPEVRAAMAEAIADALPRRSVAKKLARKPRKGAASASQTSEADLQHLADAIGPQGARPPDVAGAIQRAVTILASNPGDAHSLLGRVLARLGVGFVGIETPPDPVHGWALSGGGAKGSFEAGAIRYLAARWDELEPFVVTGTSVGAINALGVCNWGPKSAHLIPELWLTRLFVNSDMYVHSDRLKGLDEALKPTGTSVDQLIGGGGLPGGALVPDWGYAVANLVLPGFGGLFIDAIANGIAFGVMKDVLEKATKLDRVFSLAPTRALLKDVLGSLDPRTRLRLVMVSMWDGKAYYIDEHARALRLPSTQPRGSTEGSLHFLGDDYTDALIRAAIASASIPVLFGCEPVMLSASDDVMTLSDAMDVFKNGDKETLRLLELHQMVDGGLRDVLPVHAAVEAGANIVIAVSAGARGGAKNEAFGWRSWINGWFGNPQTTVVGQIPRTIDILVNEVGETDRLEGASAQVIFIDPLQDVHDMTTINPGLIRINVDYGYMRAFDACESAPANIKSASALVQFLWVVAVMGCVEEIVSLRRQVWELEFKAAVQMLTAGFAIERGTLDAIRQLKRDIYEKTKLRIDLWASKDAVPVTLPAGLVVEDWWLAWERHGPPWGALLSALGGPWALHLVRSNGVVSLETQADVGAVPPHVLA